MLPYITYSELETLEARSGTYNPYFLTVNCQGVNFNSRLPDSPVHIEGIWKTLSENKNVTIFTNYKIDGQAMQANISNAEIGMTVGGTYYLHYSTPYGEFFVIPQDDVYFVPRTISLKDVVPADATFGVWELAHETGSIDQNSMYGYRYVFPAGTCPDKLSKYLQLCTVSLNGPANLRHVPANIDFTQSANGTIELKISLQSYNAAGSVIDIKVSDCFLSIN